MNETTPKEKLGDILKDINMKRLTRRYFNRTQGWMYHKLNGTLSNGKPEALKEEEVIQLKAALYDLATRIHQAADRL